MVALDINIPVVPLPGSERWTGAYEYGNVLERKFPGHDADVLATAMEYNDYGPARDQEIVRIVMVQEGERDDHAWVWEVQFADHTTWRATGSCDYTGWDCQSSLYWEQI